MAQADMKMDKVRRLLGNRYGEEGRIAIMTVLSNVVEMLDPEESDDRPTTIHDGLSEEQIELAYNSLMDLTTRANKDPKPRKSKEAEPVAEEVTEEE